MYEIVSLFAAFNILSQVEVIYSVLEKNLFYRQFITETTVFPHIVSLETIPFWNLEIVANSNTCRNISFLLNKLLIKLDF